MRARHYQTLAAGEKLVVHEARHRFERQALVEHVFQLDVAARDGIAHDHQVGPRLKVLLAEWLRDRNAQ